MTDTEKEITKTITSIGDKLNNEYLKAGTMSKQKRNMPMFVYSMNYLKKNPNIYGI